MIKVLFDKLYIYLFEVVIIFQKFEYENFRLFEIKIINFFKNEFDRVVF